MPRVLEAVATAPQPTATLERVLNLLEAVARRSVYLALLARSSAGAGATGEAVRRQRLDRQHLTRYPLLLDDLLNPATLYAPLDRRQLARNWSNSWRAFRRMTPKKC
jgi:glutamate-ammonia-ligase adenylyltransferase